MKNVLKAIFFSVVFLIMAGCVGVLVCALNPSLTQMLAERVESMSRAQPGGAVSGSQPAEAKPGINAGWMDGAGSVGYEVPAIRPSGIPSSVSGRTGYEPVSEDAEQIGQEAADNLSESIDYGKTGSGLSFDRIYYPYYAMLQGDMQQIYRQVYANALDLAVSFAPVAPVSVEQVKTVFEAVYNDHPELFWLETGYSCKYLKNDGCVEITLKYNDTASYLDRAKREFEAAADGILAGAREKGSDEEKEKYVHDALMQTVEYDVDAAMHQSAYSALVGKKSVCAGYARAFQYLMQQLGVPCYYCTGFAGEDHAWNIVKLSIAYYNVDVTWDDTDTPTYDYFNRTDREFADTHMRTGLSVYLPACLTDRGSSSGTSGADAIVSDLSDLINPNPVKPLEWHKKKEPDNSDAAEEEKKRENLKKAGITEDEVLDTLKEYYEDCLKQLKAVGKGDQHFSNVVPATLWNAVERAYGSGDYKKGYMDEALKALGVENVSIQLQLDDLSGGYYRIYHNLYTY